MATMTLHDSSTDADAIDAAALRELLASTPDVLLLDVREPVEHAAGAIDGSTLVPLGRLFDAARTGSLAGTIPATDGPVVAYCAHGIRSARALSLLQAHGYPHAVHLAGGYEAWLSSVAPS